MTLMQRVRHGALVLDANVGDWTDRINLSTLDLADVNSCILGQVFTEDRYGYESGFSAGCRELFGEAYDGDEAVDHGFDDYTSYSELNAAWRALLAERGIVGM